MRFNRFFIGASVSSLLSTLVGLTVLASPSVAAPSSCATPNARPSGASVPAPFLRLPFRKKDGNGSLIVSNGWTTAVDEEPFTGPGPHKALDFEFTRQADHGYGLPVVAAADGRAYYTYQNWTDNWTDSNGVTRRIGLGAGLVVEVRHANGFVTQYIHLKDVASGIPYLRPEPSAVPGDWVPTPLFQSNETLWDLGVPVRAGQVLGTQGDTGIGLDWNDSFDVQTGTVAARDRLAMPPWDPSQLHFQVYQGRVDGVKQNILDPSDGYWQVGLNGQNQYTPKPGKFCSGPGSLWLTGANGKPKYAA